MADVMRVIKTKSVLSGKIIYIWIDYIQTMTANDSGQAVITMVNGDAHAVHFTPREIIDLIEAFPRDA